MSGNVVTYSAPETEALGLRLGTLMKKRGGPVTVCLFGELGAGKTTFVKGFASAFGIPGRDIGSGFFIVIPFLIRAGAACSQAPQPSHSFRARSDHFLTNSASEAVNP